VRRIVRDLKVFSRPAADERAAVDVHRVLESCVNMAGNEIRHRARLERCFSPDVPLVLGDEARIGQVFLNLLVNAAQAIPAGKGDRAGEVRLVTRSEQSGTKVVVEVTDSGVGIPGELLSHVFDPFFTTKPVGGGSGLGLSISHSLVTGMGGTIEVESVVGRGTCVRVTLPAAPKGARARPTSVPPPAPPAATKKRILVVDDDARVARTVERLLEGHDVVVATSGREAIDVLRSKAPFDVVLCDLMMPDVGGEGVYRALKEMSPGAEQRVVFMSGGAFTPGATQFLAEVPNRCLEKPFQMDALLRAVDETPR
jgi:CheY-like chemotaxis protein